MLFKKRCQKNKIKLNDHISVYCLQVQLSDAFKSTHYASKDTLTKMPLFQISSLLYDFFPLHS